MRPLIATPFSEMSDAQKAAFVEARRAARGQTPGRRPRGRTVAALAKAWVIEPSIIIEAARSLMPKDPEGVEK